MLESVGEPTEYVNVFAYATDSESYRYSEMFRYRWKKNKRLLVIQVQLMVQGGEQLTVCELF